jgi:hypothetical protein
MRQVTVHQCNKCTANEYKMQTLTVILPHVTEWIYQKKLPQIKNYSYTNFLCLLLFPTISLSMPYLSHFTTLYINSRTLHMHTPHTHTHTTTENEEPEVTQKMHPWIHRQKSLPTHHVRDDKKYSQNSPIPSHSGPISHVPYHYTVTQKLD